MTTTRFGAPQWRGRCPECGSLDGIRQVLIGMSTRRPLDPDEYYVMGGCVTHDSTPECGCLDCGWSGWYGELLPQRSAV